MTKHDFNLPDSILVVLPNETFKQVAMLSKLKVEASSFCTSVEGQSNWHGRIESSEGRRGKGRVLFQFQEESEEGVGMSRVLCWISHGGLVSLGHKRQKV